MTENSLLTPLRRALEDLDAAIYIVAEEEVSGKVVELLKSKGTERVALSSDALLEDIRLAETLIDKGIEVIKPLNPLSEPVAAAEWRHGVAESAAGITSALAVSAETGSALIMAGCPDMRPVSLLPERHIIIVKDEQIVPDIESLFQKWTETGATQGNAVIISGPSRTADIEKELVLGVHGPGELAVVVII